MDVNVVDVDEAEVKRSRAKKQKTSGEVAKGKKVWIPSGIAACQTVWEGVVCFVVFYFYFV